LKSWMNRECSQPSVVLAPVARDPAGILTVALPLLRVAAAEV